MINMGWRVVTLASDLHNTGGLVLTRRLVLLYIPRRIAASEDKNSINKDPRRDANMVHMQLSDDPPLGQKGRLRHGD